MKAVRLGGAVAIFVMGDGVAVVSPSEIEVTGIETNAIIYSNGSIWHYGMNLGYTFFPMSIGEFGPGVEISKKNDVQ